MPCPLAEAVRNASYSGAQDNGGALTAMLDRADAVINRPMSDQDHQTAADYFGLSQLSEDDQAEVVVELYEAIKVHRPHRLAA